MSHRTLFVATPGGHIEELFDLASRIEEVGRHRLWVTARTPQTSRLLATEDTHWVRPVGSRQGWRALASLPTGLALVRRYRPHLVISTGAALAVPYLVAARAHGVETHYVESATRLDAPSVTGRILARIPGTHLHHQGLTEPHDGWRAVSDVFEGYQPGPRSDGPIRRVVLTLGTERFPFPRAVEQVTRALPEGAEVLAQTGHTPVPPGAELRYRPWVPADELAAAVQDADLVVMHAGVGSVLSALRAGKHPVVLPRASALGEHIDDHQLQLADLLAARGLATIAGPDDDLTRLLAEAARRSTVRAERRSVRLGTR